MLRSELLTWYPDDNDEEIDQIIHEARQKAIELWDRIQKEEEPKDHGKSALWFQKRNHEFFVEYFWLRDNIKRLVHKTAKKNYKDLGKQYGIASDTIRRLRGEIAILEQDHAREKYKLEAEVRELKHELSLYKQRVMNALD